MSKRALSQAALLGLMAAPEEAPQATFTVAEKTYKSRQVAGLAKVISDAMAAEAVAKGKWMDARAATATARAQNEPVLKEVRSSLATMFSSNTGALAALGVSPRKARKAMDTQTRLVASAKRSATRLARGTKGKKAKLAITGNVSGVVVTPVTTAVVTPSGTSAATTASAQVAQGSAVQLATQSAAAPPVANGGVVANPVVNGASH